MNFLEYIFPGHEDRISPEEWVDICNPDLIKEATVCKRQILDAPGEALIFPATDAETRVAFNNDLPR